MHPDSLANPNIGPGLHRGARLNHLPNGCDLFLRNGKGLVLHSYDIDHSGGCDYQAPRLPRNPAENITGEERKVEISNAIRPHPPGPIGRQELFDTLGLQ
jgi:hypothetical protein